MTRGQRLKVGGATMAFAGVAMAGILFDSPRGRADDRGGDSDSRIEQGFEIAPVPLNLEGKNPALVGLGSYFVNGPGDCNACHNPGPGNNQFLPGGNPFFGQPKKINPATYLGGGRDFGDFPPGSGTAHIISRNLTPDKTGLPEGGRSFSDFVQIMRTGVDLDHAHPNCSATITANCFPTGPGNPPFVSDLLQVMPWPIHKNMTDHDLRAIYEYLGTIPCIEGPPAPSLLHNDCQ